MESLSLNPCNIKGFHQSKTLNSPSKADFRGIKQVGFAQFWRKGEKVSNFAVKIQSLGNEGGFTASGKNGSSSSTSVDEVEGQKGHLMGSLTDSCGAVVGFQLFPPKDEQDRTKVAGEIQDVEEESTVKGQVTTPNKVTYNIVFVTSEAAPYSKTGGLGDVCGSLPISLAERGHRVMVVSPRYIHGTPADKIYAGALDVNCRIKVNCFGGEQEVAFFHEYRAGVDWVFVDHLSYHRPGNPYGDTFGAFGDNQFRFTLLCHAACEAPLVLPLGGFTYGEKCLFLVNDWHAGLVPVGSILVKK